jgi:hypothetical protein
VPNRYIAPISEDLATVKNSKIVIPEKVPAFLALQKVVLSARLSVHL